jgi:nitrite reductase/ring-hydroxylating ferredoxin subunit
MPETPATTDSSGSTPDQARAVVLCPSSALADGGKAHVFDLLEYGQPARAFVLRYQGRVVGYMNRCAHVPAEMDWQPGEFLDDSGRWIICSIHGAAYEPSSGHCVSGPCRGARLQPIEVAERDGEVCWYPSRHLGPVFSD